MENEFRIKKINAKEKVEFHNKEKLTRLRHSWWLKSMEKIWTSPLTATTMKMNSSIVNLRRSFCER